MLPPFFGIFTMLLVLGFFNSQLIAAKIHALTYKPVEIRQQLHYPKPASSSQPKARRENITIESAGVDAPVIYNVDTVDETAFQLALRGGVVHYPGTSLPGKPGNAVIFGHSSGQVWAAGDYKFVFAHLEELDNKDRIVLEHKGVRYVYRVFNKKVVPPSDISVLNQIEDNNILTLITCTPVGTNTNRLIVVAEQISPTIKSLTRETQKTTPATEIATLPSEHSPSLWESIRSLF